MIKSKIKNTFRTCSSENRISKIHFFIYFIKGTRAAWYHWTGRRRTWWRRILRVSCRRTSHLRLHRSNWPLYGIGVKKEAIRHVVRDAGDDRVVASDVHHRQVVVKCEIDRMSIQAEIEPGLYWLQKILSEYLQWWDRRALHRWWRSYKQKIRWMRDLNIHLLERARDSGVVSDNGLDGIVLDDLIDGTDLVVSLDHKRGTN